MLHYLFMQLCICGVCHVLFLHGRVYECRVMMSVAVVLVVHTDAFLKNQFHPFLTYAFAEMDKLSRIAGKAWRKLLHATKYW